MTENGRGGLFRPIVPHQHSRVTYAELFFDLVFVFAVTQISHTLLAHFTPLGVLQVTLLFLAVWWVWVYTSWITNWLNPEKTPVRLLLFAMMLGGLVLSTSIPAAFDGRGLWFAIAYAAMQVGKTVFLWISTPRSRSLARMNAIRITAWLSVSAIFWIAGGLVQGQSTARARHRRRRDLRGCEGRRRRARLSSAAEGGSRRRRPRHAARRGPAEIESAYSHASSEAVAAFADGTLYVEKAITPARHVEIQVICDTHGDVLTCGERECSIQRRHQKLIEESPSPALDAELREAMESSAERACRHIGYRNAGTFEFLVGPDGAFSFIELNARLQVEHPVTELVTQLDLVRMQVRVAAGEQLPLTGRAPRSGHAIEIRINAEDPARASRRSPGRLERFRPPLGPGRARRHVRRGRQRHLAVLRLADREGGRPRRHARRMHRASAACAARARHPGGADDA